MILIYIVLIILFFCVQSVIKVINGTHSTQVNEKNKVISAENERLRAENERLRKKPKP